MSSLTSGIAASAPQTAIRPVKAASTNPYVVRLNAALLDAERRMLYLQAARGSGDPVVTAAGMCLRNAKEQAEAQAHFVAWDCLHQFDDEVIAALTPAELRACWPGVAAEAAEKLKGWRLEAAKALIKSIDPAIPVPLEVVRAIRAHLAAASQNQMHKIDVYERKTLPVLTAFLAVLVGGTLVFSYLVINSPAPPDNLLPWARALLLGVLAGGLGGILSMTFSLGSVDLSKRIPDMRLGRLVTFIRPLLGAAVAIPVVVFIEAGAVEIKGLERPLSYLAFCFLAGFSERWFLGVVENFGAAKK